MPEAQIAICLRRSCGAASERALTVYSNDRADLDVCEPRNVAISPLESSMPLDPLEIGPNLVQVNNVGGQSIVPAWAHGVLLATLSRTGR